MYGYDSDGGYGSWSTKSRVQGLIKNIQTIERFDGPLSQAQKVQLAGYREELEQIRKKCPHYWQVVQLFTHYRRFCEFCDAEDMTYNHWEFTKIR